MDRVGGLWVEGSRLCRKVKNLGGRENELFLKELMHDFRSVCLQKLFYTKCSEGRKLLSGDLMTKVIGYYITF